jgi:hypothetical protein
MTYLLNRFLSIFKKRKTRIIHIKGIDRENLISGQDLEKAMNDK